MSLRKEFKIAISAGEKLCRINTDEITDCLKTLKEVALERGWELRVWDHVAGTIWLVGTPPEKKDSNPLAVLNSGTPEKATTPLDALLRFLNEEPQPVAYEPEEVQTVILVLKNFHLAFDRDRGATVAALQHIADDKLGNHPKFAKLSEKYAMHGLYADSDTGKFVVGLMPAEAKLPPEISPMFRVIDHELPDEEELQVIFDGVVPLKDDDTPLVPSEVKQKVCKFARGLTRLQAEGVFSAGIVKFHNSPRINDELPKFVWEEKSKILNKEGLVTLYDGNETFDDVVGQQGLKDLIRELLTPDECDPDNPDLRSKGLALVGPPRTGKSLTAKAAGNTLGLPTLMVDVGSWMGSYVGDTERNTRKGFQIIRAHAPCIAIIDEVEKVMPSARGGDHDSGVGRRMAGTFMTYMQDMKEQVFWVFTANSVEDLHEAFLDDDRIDAKVYVKMPGPAQRAEAWRKFIQKFFPAEINGKAFARHLSTDALQVLQKHKTDPPNVLAEKLLPGVLCSYGEQRMALLDKIRKVSPDAGLELEKILIDDEGWTIARIKSVCRLARKRRRSLYDVAKTMPRKQTIRANAIARLEKWAAEEAIDAETGLAYVPSGESEEVQPKKTAKTGVGGPTRRKLKKLD